ncbi:serine threonine protein kinase [Stylonychia lemnae]|uniref:Serine threonine protein kinase n=1 Tax=Stylonychia lemnae TaxID=5949 RepID=A0A078AFQ7_STYLE|nr:serine threonine protein kinase [Stylonychia lemnae]|eukprot:CDW80327.1 serine threonine protein kinase [Stylonychia lemnae]
MHKQVLFSKASSQMNMISQHQHKHQQQKHQMMTNPSVINGPWSSAQKEDEYTQFMNSGMFHYQPQNQAPQITASLLSQPQHQTILNQQQQQQQHQQSQIQQIQQSLPIQFQPPQPTIQATIQPSIANENSSVMTTQTECSQYSFSERYRIISELGQGSFSRIFKAYDRDMNLEVALKMEKEDKAKRILQTEYQYLKKLQGQSRIVQVYNFVEFESQDQQNFIVMALKGQNLGLYKKNQRSFNDSLAADLLVQMLEGIQQVHQAGFIHRDIKPGNYSICKHQCSQQRGIIKKR